MALRSAGIRLAVSALTAAAAIGCADETGPAESSPSQPTQTPQPTDAARAEPPAAEWVTVTELGGQVSVQMPGSPQKQTASQQTAKGPVEIVVYKSQHQNVFWNFAITTYPQAVIDELPDLSGFLARLAEANRLQKAGSRLAHLHAVQDAPVPGVEYRIDYPAGTNSAGLQYAAGYAFHEQYLIGNQVCSLFVDVSNAVHQADPGGVEALVDRFFDSLRIETMQTHPSN